ncbi:MAG: winged helix-turn-helix domain-containing protein [Acidobacteriota bacterium]|nr:winged helix-turn-helix domain-containing protein [Acidobacteriota bacterium]
MSLDVKSNQSQFNINALNSNSERIYEFDSFRLDVAHLMLYENEQPVNLAPKVVETLLALVEKHGEIIGKDELMNRLWKDSFVEESNLVQNIYLLRKTLGKRANGDDLIETFRRRGYRFNGEFKETENSEMILAVQTRTRIIEEEVLPDEISTDEARHKIRQPIAFSKISKPLMTISAICLVGVLLTAGIGAWRLFKGKNLSSNVAPNQALSISFKRLTPDIYAVNPTISPDGKYLVYSKREESGRESVWLTDLTTGAEKQIMPPSAGGYDSFRFSPDGSEIYLSIYDSKEPQFILGGIPLAGGKPHEVARDLTSPFTLSPDGSQVAFVRAADLVLADSNGGNERILASRDSEKSGLRLGVRKCLGRRTVRRLPFARDALKTVASGQSFWKFP